MSLPPKVPAYFDYLIEGFRRGDPNRRVHLGYWEDPQASSPAADRSEFARAQGRLDALLLSMAALAPQQSVLDVGCGFGGTLETINRTFGAMRLTGVNIDPRQLDICSLLKPAHGNLFEWRDADAGSLPFRDGSFDRVLCIEAMFHFVSRRAFFLEAGRVLRPGGTLVCSDILIDPAAKRLDVPGFRIEAPLQDGYGPWPDFWGGDADHAALSTAAGLTLAKVLDVTRNTLPSHRYTAPEGASLEQDLHTGNAALRASLMLRWLHAEGHLRYVCLRFDKAA
jgi:SAM-dependent methyltransferase